MTTEIQVLSGTVDWGITEKEPSTDGKTKDLGLVTEQKTRD